MFFATHACSSLSVCMTYARIFKPCKQFWFWERVRVIVSRLSSVSTVWTFSFPGLELWRQEALSVTQDQAERWICVCLSVKKDAQTQKVNSWRQWSNCLPKIRTLVLWFMSGLSQKTSRICSHTLNQSYAATSIVLWLAHVQRRMHTVYWTQMLYAFHITAIFFSFTFLFTFPKQQLKHPTHKRSVATCDKWQLRLWVCGLGRTLNNFGTFVRRKLNHMIYQCLSWHS